VTVGGSGSNEVGVASRAKITIPFEAKPTDGPMGRTTSPPQEPRTMKMIVFFVTASLLAAVGSARAQDKSAPKLNLDVLEKLYDTKMKSVVVTEEKSHVKTKITITFDFTKNVTDLELLNLTFAASPGIPYRFDALPLIFHFFDEDNVCIEKIIIGAIEGDLTGVRGDAFRVFLYCPTESFKKAKRIEARYYLPLPK
jgi:hypothetical protein